MSRKTVLLIPPGSGRKVEKIAARFLETIKAEEVDILPDPMIPEEGYILMDAETFRAFGENGEKRK